MSSILLHVDSDEDFERYKTAVNEGCPPWAQDKVKRFPASCGGASREIPGDYAAAAAAVTPEGGEVGDAGGAAFPALGGADVATGGIDGTVVTAPPSIGKGLSLKCFFDTFGTEARAETGFQGDAAPAAPRPSYASPPAAQSRPIAPLFCFVFAGRLTLPLACRRWGARRSS